MRYVITFILCLVCSPVFGQIDIPDSNNPYEPIVAKISTNVPEGAIFNGGLETSDGVKYIDPGNGDIYIWSKPGVHWIKFVGYWVHTKTVTFTDGDGNQVSIESYLGSGFVNEKATFTVSGGTAPDPPKPGPLPGQKYQIVFFIEADELDKMPAEQRLLVTSLSVRRNLVELGHRLILVMDDDQIREDVVGRYKPWVDAVLGDPLPRLGYAPMAGGDIIDISMPENYQALVELLEGES